MDPSSQQPRRIAPDVLVAFAALSLVALLGGVATEIGPWYFSLKQPAWKPPDWAFGPAWTLIYFTVGTACVKAWRHSSSPAQRGWLALAWFINALLNVLWSVLYFSLRRPDWALLEVGFFWLSIVWMIGLNRSIDRAATLWLVPYCVWVAFAGALNAATVLLNPVSP